MHNKADIHDQFEEFPKALAFGNEVLIEAMVSHVEVNGQFCKGIQEESTCTGDPFSILRQHFASKQGNQQKNGTATLGQIREHLVAIVTTWVEHKRSLLTLYLYSFGAPQRFR